MENEGCPQRPKSLHTQRSSQSNPARDVGGRYNHIGRYERGGLCSSADTLHSPTGTLAVSTDYLFEVISEQDAKAHLEDRELLRRFQEVEHLNEDNKAIAKRLRDAFLMKKHNQELADR